MSKRYMMKAIFIGVTSRPLLNEHEVIIHNGKFGIFPFVFTQILKKKKQRSWDT